MIVVDMVSLHRDRWSDRKRIFTWSEEMAEPGPRNLITDVPGLLVGQAEDSAGVTGTTVVSCEMPAVASVDVRGGAPGSRETELLGPATLVDRVDAIVLSGGSAFGLDAAAGVMDGLAAMGRGFQVRGVRVPIVPAAILFDLALPGRQHWTGEPPYRGLGRLALELAAQDFALGNAGAGFGAKAGRLKGGMGSASLRLASGAMVGALVAVNSWGSVVRPDCGRFWAAELALSGEIDPQPLLPDNMLDAEDFSACAASAAGANTTIALVATDMALDKAGCHRLAMMAQDGLAQAIRPAHTPFDGDTVFALSTGSGSVASPDQLTRVGAAAASCLARAIMRAVTEAEPLGGFPSWRQRWGSGRFKPA
jgi:L-aminopeptidase/D-esterase-like protein